MLKPIEHCNGLDDRNGIGNRNGLDDRNGLGRHDSTCIRAHYDSTHAREKNEPHGASMKTVKITPVSKRPHRDEDDGLTHKLKIAG